VNLEEFDPDFDQKDVLPQGLKESFRNVHFDPENGLAVDLEKFPEKVRGQVRAIVEAYSTPSPEGEELTKERHKDSLIDPLTGLSNRRSFVMSLDREIARAERNRTFLSVVFVDLDHFKEVNDRFGHAAGDEVLQEIGQTFAKNIRGSDFVARLGGEEFAILLPETNLDEAEQVAEKIRKIIEETKVIFDTKEIKVTASFGVAEKKSEESGEDFVKRSDGLAYLAKQTGRNRVCAILLPKKRKKKIVKKLLRRVRLFLHRRF
jgi:diguanylate cyclase (GGDEF)-like protein